MVTGLITQVSDVRRMGAAVVDFCWLARGRVDAYYETGLNPWDMAAGGLIGFSLASYVLSRGFDAFRMASLGAMLGVPAFVLAKVFTPPFFARQKSKRPMQFSLVSVFITVVVGASPTPG